VYHYRKTRNVYARHNKNDVAETCPFPSCNSHNVSQEYLFENDTMYIIANRVSYDLFEGREVLDHLMVIPKRHLETFDDFTDQEKLDFMAIAGEYEKQGYYIYARGVGSATRSVKHQHTHLLKMTNKKGKFLLYTSKPYFVMKV